MAKVKSSQVESGERYRMIGDMFDVVSGLKSKREIIDFFIGLYTPSEALMMARRIQIARLLTEGEGYESIKNKLKVSFQTITRTEKWLNTEDDKYNNWIKKCLEKKVKNNQKFGKMNILDRYSHHRLVKNILT